MTSRFEGLDNGRKWLQSSLRSILFLCFCMVLSGCALPGLFGAGAGLLVGPVKCAEKVSKDENAGVLDYLQVPAAILFGPFVGIARELEMPIGSGPNPQERIRYITDVCDPRAKDEYFKNPASIGPDADKQGDDKKPEEKK